MSSQPGTQFGALSPRRGSLQSADDARRSCPRAVPWRRIRAGGCMGSRRAVEAHKGRGGQAEKARFGHVPGDFVGDGELDKVGAVEGDWRVGKWAPWGERASRQNGSVRGNGLVDRTGSEGRNGYGAGAGLVDRMPAFPGGAGPRHRRACCGPRHHRACCGPRNQHALWSQTPQGTPWFQGTTGHTVVPGTGHLDWARPRACSTVSCYYRLTIECIRRI